MLTLHFFRRLIMHKKKIIRLAIITVLLLMIPLVLTIRDGGVEGVGWNWTLFDFIWAGTLIFGTGLAYEVIARKASNTQYRWAFGLGLAGAFTLIWINGAVGIMGSEDNPANLLYVGVLLTGFIGSLVSRFKPKGMSRTLFAAALVQFLVPITALIIWRPDFDVGVIQVLLLNAGWVVLFTLSGLLFRQATSKS